MTTTGKVTTGEPCRLRLHRFGGIRTASILACGIMLSAIGHHVKAADTKEPSADKAALVKGNNEFAFELYGKLRGK